MKSHDRYVRSGIVIGINPQADFHIHTLSRPDPRFHFAQMIESLSALWIWNRNL